jgi:hypothetical protein
VTQPTTIHVHSSTDKRTIGYLLFLWESMKRLATRPDLLKFTAHCIGPVAAEATTKELASDVKANAVLVQRPGWLPESEPMNGSSGHACCIDDALTMFDDGNIHIIADSDTVMVAKGWDDLVRIKLINEGVGLFGVTYEGIGGFSSGGGHSQTYKDIPNLVWAAMSPKHAWKAIDSVRPRKGRDIPITNANESKTYNLPVGYSVLRDVGWQIPQYIRDNRISYEGLEHLKPSGSRVKIIRGLSDYHEEFHVGSVPFVIHQRGSLRHSYRGDQVSVTFYNAAETWIKDAERSPPAWVWTDDASVGTSPRLTECLTPTKSSTEPEEASEGWLKVTLDGHGVRARGPINTGAYTMTFTPDQTVRHIRVEGSFTTNLVLTVPETKFPHCFTVRNMTTSNVVVKCGTRVEDVTVPAGAMSFLLADCDGITKAT